MTTLAPVNKTLDRVILPEGTHIARVVGFIQIQLFQDNNLLELKAK